MESICTVLAEQTQICTGVRGAGGAFIKHTTRIFKHTSINPLTEHRTVLTGRSSVVRPVCFL